MKRLYFLITALILLGPATLLGQIAIYNFQFDIISRCAGHIEAYYLDDDSSQWHIFVDESFSGSTFITEQIVRNYSLGHPSVEAVRVKAWNGYKIYYYEERAVTPGTHYFLIDLTPPTLPPPGEPNPDGGP